MDKGCYKNIYIYILYNNSQHIIFTIQGDYNVCEREKNYNVQKRRGYNVFWEKNDAPNDHLVFNL